MTPDPFDRELADALGLPGDPGQVEAEASALWDDMPFSAARPVAGGWLRFAVAAVVLAAAGLGGVYAWKGGKARVIGNMDTTTVVSAAGEFVVIDVASDRSTLLVQAYDDFSISRVARGGQVGGYVLKDILESGIVAQKNGEAPVTRSVEEWNREAAKRLSAEVSGLQSLRLSGGLTEEQVFRVRLIADCGDAGAVQLLSDLAAMPDLGPGAREVVSDAGKDVDLSGRLSYFAASGTDETSRYSLRKLGELGTPGALKQLGELASSLPADRAVIAVRELARQEPRRVVSLLLEVRDGARVPEVREAARVALESLAVQESRQSK